MTTLNGPRQVTVGTFKATPRMRALIGEVLDTGRISYGPMSLAFEQRFAALHGCAYAILSNSGTSALQVALQALKELHHWRDGGQVIVPVGTFIATANIVNHNRMVPVVVDVDPESYNISVEALERAMGKEAVATIPVHMFGRPADMPAITALAKARGLTLLEDSCESMFVSSGGQPVGSLGAVGCFSLYVAHLLVAGVGGVCTTNDPELAAKIRSLVNHGLEIGNLNPGANFAPRPMVGRKFLFSSRGHSFRLTELEAAVALAQLDTYQTMLRQRRENAARLIAGLRDINERHGKPLTLPDLNADSAWMMLPLVLNQRGGALVDKTPLTLWLNERGIETRDLPSLLGQPCYAYLNPDNYPVGKWLWQSGFYIGTHENLEPADIEYVLEAIDGYFAAERTVPATTGAPIHARV